MIARRVQAFFHRAPPWKSVLLTWVAVPLNGWIQGVPAVGRDCSYPSADLLPPPEQCQSRA